MLALHTKFFLHIPVSSLQPGCKIVIMLQFDHVEKLKVLVHTNSDSLMSRKFWICQWGYHSNRTFFWRLDYFMSLKLFPCVINIACMMHDTLCFVSHVTCAWGTGFHAARVSWKWKLSVSYSTVVENWLELEVLHTQKNKADKAGVMQVQCQSFVDSTL